MHKVIDPEVLKEHEPRLAALTRPEERLEYARLHGLNDADARRDPTEFELEVVRKREERMREEMIANKLRRGEYISDAERDLLRKAMRF